MFEPLDHFCGAPLDLLQQLYALLVLRAPELDAGLQVRSHQSRAEQSRAEQSRGADSPPSTCWPRFFWCSPGYVWPSGLLAHIDGSCPAFHPSVSTSPSRSGCSQSLHPPACIDTQDYPDPDAGPCAWPCWISWGSHRPIYWASPGLFGWHPMFLALSLVSYANLLSVYSISLSVSLMKILNSTGPSMDPWGRPLVTSPHLDIKRFLFKFSTLLISLEKDNLGKWLRSDLSVWKCNGSHTYTPPQLCIYKHWF